MARWLLALGLILNGTALASAQEGLWEVYHDAGVRAHSRGFDADAEKLWKSALEAVEKSGPSLAGAQTLERLADLCREQNRRSDAEAYLKRWLTATEAVRGAESAATATACQKLGEFYMQDNVHGGPLAEPLLRRALAITGKEPGVEVVAGAAGALFSCLLYTSKLDEAEQLIRWCLVVVESKPVPNQANAYAACTHCLGTIHYLRKQDAEVEADYRRAIERLEKVRGPESPDLLWILFRAGDLEYALGRYAQAEAYYRRALAIAEKAGEPMKLKATEFLMAVGIALHAQNHDAEARSCFERCLAAWDAAPPFTDDGDRKSLALMLMQMAQFAADQGRHADADALGKRALALMEQVRPGVHRDLGAVHRGLADLAFAANRPADAEKLAQQALEEDEKHFGRQFGQVGLDLSRLARAARQRNQDAEAEKLCKEALAIGEKEVSINRPQLREIVEENLALLRKLNRGEEVRQLEARAAQLRLPPARK